MSAQRSKRPISLGNRVATYRSLPPSPVTVGVWTGIALLAALQMAYLAGGIQLLGAVGGALAAVMVWVIWAINVPRRVDLYQNGIDFRVGRRHRYLFWNQIYEVYQTPLYRANRLARRQGDRPDLWMYRLVRRDGRSLRLTHLQSIRGLGRRIQEQVVRRHLPIALDAFRAGYCIRFGRHLSVSLEGIRLYHRLIEWHEIGQISIDEASQVKVTRRQPGKPAAHVAIQRVPNLLLLDGILRARQAAANMDSLDIASQRGAFSEGPFEEPVSEDTGGFTTLLSGDKQRDDSGDLGVSHDGGEEASELDMDYRPRRPK
jgi:hypothetical protein